MNNYNLTVLDEDSKKLLMKSIHFKDFAFSGISVKAENKEQARILASKKCICPLDLNSNSEQRARDKEYLSNCQNIWLDETLSMVKEVSS